MCVCVFILKMFYFENQTDFEKDQSWLVKTRIADAETDVLFVLNNFF